MSQENAKKFYDALKADKTLAEEMQNALKSQKIETKEQAQQALIDFAGNKGFSFTAAELAEFEAEATELGDDDLDKVNAGLCADGSHPNYALREPEFFLEIMHKKFMIH